MVMVTKIFFLCIVSISSTFADNIAAEVFKNANNLFTKSVYSEVAKAKKGNFMVSPFSIETISALVLSGARGETAEQLRQALHLPNDNPKVESSVKSLLTTIHDNSLYTLSSANKIYLQENFVLKDSFKRISTDIFHVDSETINFKNNVQAAKTMNAWVEQQTNKKIKDLINSDDVDKYTKAVLINALYFKANWSNPFGLSATAKRNFYKSASDKFDVDTLHHYEEYFNYYECPHLKAQILQLPFKGGEASMVFVLPDEKEGLPSLETKLDQVFSPQHDLKNTYLNVAIPKFKIETSIDVEAALTNMGVSKLFEEKKADLSGIAGDPGDLYVSKAAQKSFLEVAEEGVEAAAATFYVVAVPSSAVIGPEPKNFVADHPFIFYIKVKDVIIFAGRVTDPSK